MKKMLEAGTIKEMMWVIVSGQNSLGGSFYVNSPVSGNWEDFIINDVVGYVDKNYRTITSGDSRGIAGFSMGGFGALNLAMRHPDLFGAVYALSPGLFAPDGLSNSQMFSHQSEIEAFLGLENELAAFSPEEAEAQFVRRANQGSNLLFAVAYGAAFAPNPTKQAPYIDYPYNGAGDQPDNEVWKKWESGYGGLTEKIQLYKDNLLKLKGIIVDYGTRDPYRWIPEGCEFFSQQLEAANIPHQLMSFEGRHGPLSDRAEAVMLPFFAEALVFEADKQ
jgi:pimeloyl-ACP methyl ester carboxylesterase